MYRVHFDHTTGKFILQVCIFFGLYWATVKSNERDGYVFDTYEEAKKHVSSIGLDRLYQNRSADQYSHFLNVG